MAALNLAEEWRRQNAQRRSPDSPFQWDKRSETFGAKDSSSDYVLKFFEFASFSDNESILDMGCGPGSLAIPLAKAGHKVIAADFSPGMLGRLKEGIRREQLTGITLRCMSWDDDWRDFDIEAGCVDVSIASRSIITNDLEDSLSKLSWAASQRVCVTAGTGISPRVDPVVAQAMGITLRRHNDALFVFGIACDLGYEPCVSYIHSSRRKLFADFQDAHDSFMKTFDYVEDATQQVSKTLAARRLDAWLEEHLIVYKGEEKPLTDTSDTVQERHEVKQWCLDIPRSVPWAFITWSV